MLFFATEDQYFLIHTATSSSAELLRLPKGSRMPKRHACMKTRTREVVMKRKCHSRRQRRNTQASNARFEKEKSSLTKVVFFRRVS